MAALPQEKAYLLAAVGLVVVSAAVCGTFAWRHASAPQAAVPSVDLADTPYAATVAEAEVIKTDTWSPPPAQTRGRDWVYDTFTPPEIFYNARSKHFTVKPPAAVSEEGVVEEAFGVELVSVRPEPFRLQLIGYVGEGAAARGTFENVATGEVILGSAGRRVPKLGLTIKSFEVGLVEIKMTGGMTTRQRVATAVVLDDKTGRAVTITHRERHFTGGLSAFVAQTGEAATREVRAGETFRLGDVSYRIEKILLEPASIELTKESPTLAQPDRRTLTPRETDDAPAPADAPAPVTQ
jgi:hypothetical protein